MKIWSVVREHVMCDKYQGMNFIYYFSAVFLMMRGNYFCQNLLVEFKYRKISCIIV